jgi:hypothetical protein
LGVSERLQKQQEKTNRDDHITLEVGPGGEEQTSEQEETRRRRRCRRQISRARN